MAFFGLEEEPTSSNPSQTVHRDNRAPTCLGPDQCCSFPTICVYLFLSICITIGRHTQMQKQGLRVI